MSALPSFLSSGASSRAHHAFLVKLHRAQSDREEDEVIQQEVQRAKVDLAVKGGASLSTITDTLIILLHGSISQHRAGLFETRDDDGAQQNRVGHGNGEDWALMAALQVAEQSRDVRQKRIGYLYLAERLPQGHELRLMLINTIRKDLESKEIGHILLALNTIIKQPSADLAPAVTPILTSKSFLKHAEPAVRQRSLQGLAALHLPTAATASDFPLSMSKIVRLIASEQDSGVLCVLLILLQKLLDSRSHILQTLQEQIYLIQQISRLMGNISPESQIAISAIGALRSILRVKAVDGSESGDSGALSSTLGGLDEVLARLISEITSCEGLGGALVLEMCSLLGVADSNFNLPLTTRQCLKILSDVLCPNSSSSQLTLPPANDHVLVLRCLSHIPLDRWDGELGAEEMGVIMRGLESGDDSVRKATLKLLQHTAPEVLDQTFSNYLTALHQRSDLALPPQFPSGLDDSRKLQLALRETSTRALELVVVGESGQGGGQRAADGVYAILEAMQGSEGDVAMDDDVVWEEGLRSIRDLLEQQTPTYRAEFASRLISRPSIPNQTALVLRSLMVCDYLNGDLDGDAITDALLADLALAKGGELQEKILAAVVFVMSSPKRNDVETVQQASRRLGEMLREKKMSKQIQSLVGSILDVLSAGAVGEIRTELGPGRHELRSILRVIEVVRGRHRLELDLKDGASTAHIPRNLSGTGSVRDVSRSTLRYGAYESPSFKKSGSTMQM